MTPPRKRPVPPTRPRPPSAVSPTARTRARTPRAPAPHRRSRSPGSSATSRARPSDGGGEPDQRDEPVARDADREAGQQGAERGRAGQRPEGQALLVRAAVQHPVDEDRATDDRGREGIAGQQRDEGRGAERDVPEEADIQERIRAAAARSDDGQRRSRRTRSRRGRSRSARCGSRAPGVGRARRSSVRATSPVASARPKTAAPSRSMRPLRRGVSHPGDAAQARSMRADGDRDVDEEDPAPGRAEDGRDRWSRPRPAPASAEPPDGSPTGSRRRGTVRRPCRGT